MSSNEEFKKNLLSGKPRRYGQVAYAPDEFGTWRVYGEDPNCDLGGPHHEPDLGTFTGLYKDVVNKAVDLPGFFTWGGGGKIVKEKTINLTGNLVNGEDFSATKATVYVVTLPREIKVFGDEEEAIQCLNANNNARNITIEKRVGLVFANDKVLLVDKKYESALKFVPVNQEKLRNEAMRKAALEKLTPEERKLLGLTK